MNNPQASEAVTKIIDKVKKLLAKGDVARGATPEEAALVMEKVQELLTRHNLEMCDLEDAPEKELIDHEIVVMDRVQRYDFEENIARILTRCFGIKVIWTRTFFGGKMLHSYILVGEDLDRTLCKIAIPILVKAMRLGVAAHLRERGIKKWTAVVGHPFYRGLEDGYILGNMQGQARAYAQAQKANVDRYALVLVDKEKAIATYVDKTFKVTPGKAKAHTKSSDWDHDAYHAGVKVGEKLDLGGNKHLA